MENQVTSGEKNGVIETKEWVITLLLAAIPVVNLIMLFIWAFGSDANRNKANWAKATLLWMAVGFVLWLFFAMILGLSFFSAAMME